ncbi:uncharacterized protein LOC110989769 [Acanthaster planci]|uniref:Uncharacterized protein LOC110989769 n=1 Tax=Acanthaster planci TaxID=133434 RepID=A0A8B7ZZC7_ACAPL|nr:uncharacterized protein LOC110989769 [Acanthaster planci]
MPNSRNPLSQEKRQQRDRRVERKQLGATRTAGDRSDGKTNRSNGADVSHTTIQMLSIGGRAVSARGTSFLLGEETCEPSYEKCHSAAVGNSCVTYETVPLEDSDTDSVTREKQEYDTLYQKTLPAPTGR